jgi:hypothetical protein
MEHQKLHWALLQLLLLLHLLLPAALKNLRLEGVLEPFNDFLSLIICISSLS